MGAPAPGAVVLVSRLEIGEFDDKMGLLKRMSGLRIFNLLLLVLAIAAGCVIRRMSPARPWPSMLTKGSFKELQALGRYDQEQIFSQSWNTAFSGWRWYVWECIFWVCFFSLYLATDFIEPYGWPVGLICTAAYAAIFWILRSWEFAYLHPVITDFAQKYRAGQTPC
jgi:hypothetical protein